jgi:hypothetical protein
VVAWSPLLETDTKKPTGTKSAEQFEKGLHAKVRLRDDVDHVLRSGLRMAAVKMRKNLKV